MSMEKLCKNYQKITKVKKDVINFLNISRYCRNIIKLSDKISPEGDEFSLKFYLLNYKHGVDRIRERSRPSIT